MRPRQFIRICCLAGLLLPAATGAESNGRDKIDTPAYRARMRRAGAALEAPKGSGSTRSQPKGSSNGSCVVTMQQSRNAFNVATYFSWYRERSQFECMSAQPLEGFFKSSDRRRIREHFERLATNGFDGFAGVIYADPRGSGRVSREMRWMQRAIEEADEMGFQFIPLYDFSIASSYSAKLCNVFAGHCPEHLTPVTGYNFDTHPVLQRSVVADLVMIADRFILPYANLKRPRKSTVKFLQRSDGSLVRDEYGLPRPEIYIYIPRVWSDNSELATIARVIDQVTTKFRHRGLGKPAFTLDVIEPPRFAFRETLVAAFGDTAVRLTSFFAITNNARDMGQLAKEQEKMFRRSARKLTRLINRGALHGDLQIAAGTAVNFDKRAWAECNEGFGDLAWPTLEPADWKGALETLVENTQHPVCKSSALQKTRKPPPQNVRFIYAGEGFEGTWMCARNGLEGERYPNQYGCQPLKGFGELMRDLGEK